MDEAVLSKQMQLLARITEPSSTAVLTMELQNGVVGPDALLQSLRDEVTASGMLDVAGRVCRAARAVGARVVHATAENRPDGLGASTNCKILALAAKRQKEFGGGPLDIGSVGALLVDELDLHPTDLIVPRLSGMSPFTPSALDQVLRNLGVTTIVLTGVSVNLGIFGAAMSALDLGYQVVLVRDAVVGVPRAYGEAVIENSLSMICTVVTADELLEVWSHPSEGGR